ncbi:receptor-like protein kinase 7 [Corylus avellana]|uniref:receptor-like protein kinase 7 n=1 Tax=Corylus avellana TaxID=13451 RepID=UPI00286B2327|nr:receptor-like protein kinase 7 [Corylus avellana]
MSPPNTSRPHHYPCFYLLCFLSFLSGVKSDELQILLKLKSALQDSTANVFSSWEPTSNSICHFTGITCNSDNLVTEIELSNQNLTGTVPLDSICQLQSLEKLSFGFNLLNGPITQDLNKCVNLHYLDLANNFFTGPVPDISSLTKLQYLHLNNSGFSGIFPWDSLRNMKGLVRLSLGDNPFNPSPIPSDVVHLTKLDWLYLSNCNIQGPIPAGIGTLTKLINLEFSDNNMTGEIPEEIGNLVNLWQLELYNNSFTGKLPASFRNLTKLEMFDASINSLEGDMSELRFLTNLASLQLYENNLSGQVPAELGEFKMLVNLSLYSNRLTGPLPQKLGSWGKFDFIDVSDNLLTGPIPPDMCKQGTMKKLLLLNNNFTGEIPVNYANCSTLIRFRVPNNLLSGTVPAGIWGLPNVNIIDISSNNIQGPITSDIKNAKSLEQLFVGDNRLSGELPVEISGATSLVSIQLNDNQFSGNIPSGVGELKQLNSLHLQNNKFSGSIPDTLSTGVSLTDINMANNSLSGQIPSSLGSLPTLNALNLSNNQLSGEIPETFSSLRLSLLDLSHNRLTGPVPQFLSLPTYNGSFAANEGLCSSMTSSLLPRCPSASGISREFRTLIICFTVGSTFLLILSNFVFLFYLKKREKDKSRSSKDESWDGKSYQVLSFTEDEILDSVKQENLIGKGGSGNVYKAVLPNGKELAVKHIWNANSSRGKSWSSTAPMLGKRGETSKEFDSEVQTLSSIRHENVVKLYCSITSEDSSLLVYEYLPNGSLWDQLHLCRKPELDWETRYEIAVGGAKGLEYLHHGCERPVIHRDVKSSNILLDEFLKPRIADFGLAKIVQANGDRDFTPAIAGKHGYIAPESGYTYKVNEKSDVYGFGVVLMELVTGKRPIEPEYGENKDIVNWVSSKVKNTESVLSVVDSRISEAFKEDAVKVLKIAILCTAALPALRPTMRTVVQMLEEAAPYELVAIVIDKDGAEKPSLEL